LGVVPYAEAFAGFGHPATIIVALVLVVSAGLVRSGAVMLITRTLIDAGRPLGRHIAVMGGVGAALSGFMNNVAALALLMPVDIETARKAGRNPGLTLMPLSFATILGGMVTLIGTPPNIIIAQIRGDTLGQPFAMFDFAPVGAVAAIAGLAFVALIGWRLIPQPADDPGAGAALADIAPYVAELTVPEGSDRIGQRVAELEPAAEAADVTILGVLRGGKRLFGMARSTVLRAGDVLMIEATPEALEALRVEQGLAFAETGSRDPAGGGLALIEAVVPEGARIAGRSARAIGLGWRQNALLLGISRQGRTLRSQLRRTRVRAGDILLLLLPEGDEARVMGWLGVLPLDRPGVSVTADGKTWAAIGLFAAAVAAASLGAVALPVALGLVVVTYVLSGILPLREVYDHIEWPVVVLLGSMIPLGAALDAAGGTALIAGALSGLAQGWPAWAVLVLLMAVTMTLSDVLNNTATAIVAAPVAIAMAETLDASPDPFLMAVAVAASAAFLTPIGHKNNTLVLGPGGYRFGDYWRMGLPLELLIVAVSVPAILVFWPL
ncbi:MAG: SLC13 family permease, partial [Rhodobacteraceae bacterium]|nr:SLC13 family permease [Paracoccaceae bacterium]